MLLSLPPFLFIVRVFLNASIRLTGAHASAINWLCGHDAAPAEDILPDPDNNNGSQAQAVFIFGAQICSVVDYRFWSIAFLRHNAINLYLCTLMYPAQQL